MPMAISAYTVIAVSGVVKREGTSRPAAWPRAAQAMTAASPDSTGQTTGLPQVAWPAVSAKTAAVAAK